MDSADDRMQCPKRLTQLTVASESNQDAQDGEPQTVSASPLIDPVNTQKNRLTDPTGWHAIGNEIPEKSRHHQGMGAPR